MIRVVPSVAPTNASQGETMPHTPRLAGWLGVIALTLAAAPAPAGDVTLQNMSYQELGKLVRSHKGKVVVVDFWHYD
jgi:hypothetical protein